MAWVWVSTIPHENRKASKQDEVRKVESRTLPNEEEDEEMHARLQKADTQAR
jgi:hypothetical protein